MKPRIYLFFIFSFLFQVFSSAQQNRFLYIQTENKQPFYVNLNDQILSSSASGYLIIPKLQEGTYQLTIGFPKNEWPRQVISYTIGKKDQGVLLKNFGDQGWGFYNLQNSETTMAAGNKPKAEVVGDEDTDSFIQVLSEVVNTPDLKIKTKVEEPVPAFVPDTKPAEPIVAMAPRGIKRLSENINDQGRELMYADEGDTISIFIPATVAKVQQAIPKLEDTSENQPGTSEKAIGSADKVVKETPAIVEIKTGDESQVSKSLIESDMPGKQASTIRMVNSDCRSNAGDEDFMKLRKKMASEDNEVKMVVVAKKAFKSKCYSTSQIKNLSVLFLNDSGRFQFFESAYPYVFDSNNFKGLQSQLTDPYYITRFETLLRR